MARILVIDDSATSRDIIAHMLATSGHDVVKVASAAEGLKEHRRNPVEMVITDIYMPETDGYETIRLFRSVRPEPKILAVSGGGNFTERSVLEVAEDFGACGGLRKPISSDELNETVRLCLAETQMARPNGTAE